MEALQLQLKQKAVIDFNKDQLDKHVTRVEEKYKDIVVTENNLSDIGKDRAGISKLNKEIKTRYIEVKKQALEPIAELETAVKESSARLDAVYRSIKDQEDKFEHDRREAVKAELEEIRQQALSDNHVNENYAYLVELKDAYLNKTANREKILDELAEQAKNAYTVQKAASDAKKLKEQKQKMIAEFCQMYSDKHNLVKPIQSIAFNHLIDSEIDEIQSAIEQHALKQAESQAKEEAEVLKKKDRAHAEEQSEEKPAGSVETIADTDTEEPAKTMRLLITANTLQRIALTEFMRNSGIKFEVLIENRKAA